MATVLGRDVVVQLLQGFQEVKLEVQDLKLRVSELEGQVSRLEGRMDKLEARMDKLEARMDKLEALSTQILEHVKSIAAMLIELPSQGRDYNGLRERVADHERRITALEH
jgi:chromosome segregation ATPase